MAFLIADVETTGLTSNDEICEVAFMEVDQNLSVITQHSSLIKPTLPISPAASAASHITDRMVENSPSASEFFSTFPGDYFRNITLLAHNSQFDVRFLSPHWEIDKDLCTMRLARKIYPDSPNFKLQTLRYYLDLEVEGGAHRAMEDVLCTYALVKRMAQDSGMGLEEMVEVVARPIKVKVMPFGKHRGCPIDELPDNYARWLLGLPDLDSDLRHTLEKRYAR